MTGRCSCPDQGDDVVFGQCRKCYPKPALVTSEDLMFYERSHPNPWPEERPYEQALDESERTGG